MYKKIVGILICMLLIGPVVLVTADMDIQTTCKVEDEPISDWKVKYFFFGFIKNPDQSVPGYYAFDFKLVFYSRCYDGKVDDRGIFVRGAGNIPYNQITGFIGNHFICCTFK